jgi:ribokinase
LIVTPRARGPVAQGGIAIDALVHSGGDAGEVYRPGDIEPEPRYVLSTAGKRGGRFVGADGATGAWEAARLPGEARDAYGAGDSFAAGVTYGLGAGMPIDEAVRLGARCGAHNICGRGPYEGQLVLAGRDAPRID